MRITIETDDRAANSNLSAVSGASSAAPTQPIGMSNASGGTSTGVGGGRTIDAGGPSDAIVRRVKALAQRRDGNVAQRARAGNDIGDGGGGTGGGTQRFRQAMTFAHRATRRITGARPT